MRTYRYTTTEALARIARRAGVRHEQKRVREAWEKGLFAIRSAGSGSGTSSYPKPDLIDHPVLTESQLKNLSYVAYHQLVSQTQVAEVRGSHVYRHLKQLEKHNFITRQDKGRTKIVKTTNRFADYFGLSRNLGAIKRQLKKMFKKEWKLSI